MTYIHQHRDFALGNFINLTPAIRWLAAKEGAPVKVYFETPYVAECFQDCPFIERIYELPGCGPLLTSGCINPSNEKPDYQYVFEFVTGKPWTPDWHTYVDQPTPEPCEVLLINGSGNNAMHYVQKKDPGEGVYEDAADAARRHGLRVVACGSFGDLARAPYMARIADDACWGNMRRTLALIAGARCVIANDTGLAHAAGAMNKPLLMLWKDTPRERCKNAGQNTRYLYGVHKGCVLYSEFWYFYVNS